MGVCMVLTAVTNTQLNDFYSDHKAMERFLNGAGDISGHILRMVEDTAAANDPKYLPMARLLTKGIGLIKNADMSVRTPSADLDKVWHGMHWILTGTASGGAEPLCYLCSKGLVLGQFREDKVRGISSKQLAAMAAAVEPINEAEIRRRYNGKAMVEAKLYLSLMWGRDGDEGIEALTYGFDRLRAFFAEARAQNMGMLIWTT